MKNNRIIKFFVATALLFVLFIATFSILGLKERTGYISEFNTLVKKGFVAKDGEYPYHARIKYHSKTFRNNDIYGVYPSTNNIPSYITSIEFDFPGSPYAKITSTKELKFEDRIDDVGYTLKVKSNIMIWLFSILVYLIFITVIYTNREKINHEKVFSKIAGGVLIAIVLSAVLYNLFNAGWLFGDDFDALRQTVQGKLLFFSDIRLGSARLFPLGHFHYNLLIPFGYNPFAYLALIDLFFIVLIFVIYKLFLSITNKAYLSSILTIFLLLMPDIISNLYYQIIFPESIVLPLIAIFIFCYKKGVDTNKSLYFIVSGFICAYTTYCKEPVFGMFLVFALTNLIFGYKDLVKKQKYLLFFIVLNAIIFVSIYAYLFRNATVYYGQGRDGGIGRLGTFIYFLKLNYLFGITIVLSLFRGFCILFKKDRKLLFFDACLFSGIAYSMAYVFLKLPGSYYVTPSYVLYILAFTGYIKHLLDNKKIVESKNNKLYLNIALFTVLLVVGISQYKNITNQLYGTVLGRKMTAYQTQLLLALEDANYEMYVYFPKEIVGHAIAAQNWRRNVLNVFTSVYRNNGKYVEDYTPIKTLKDGDSLPLNKNIFIMYDNSFKLNYDSISNINTNFGILVDESVMWTSSYVQDTDTNRFENILSKIKSQYLK